MKKAGEIESEIISDGCRSLSYRAPIHERPSGRRRSISAEDDHSYWNRVFSSKDSEEIDSEEAQDRFVNYVITTFSDLGLNLSLLR